MENMCSGGFDPHDPSVRSRQPEAYRRLREECPVAHSNAWGGFWFASRYRDIFRVARTPEKFLSGPGVVFPEIGHGRPLLPMDSDPPRHSLYRRLLLPRFSPQAMTEIEPQVRRRVADLIEQFYARGKAELTEDVAKKVPMFVICRMLGIEQDVSTFWTWADELVYGRLEKDSDVRSAADQLYGYFETVVAERRNAPGEDLISLLIFGDLNGERLTHQEVLDHCFFLLLAGLDNTAFGIRALLWYVASEPSIRRTLREKPELIPSAVEETLRLFTPVTGLARTVVEDTTLAGCTIPAGDRVLLLWGSANRDEREFEAAEEFRLGRSPNRHLAFGIGIHRCLGSHLARMEMRVTLEEVLRRIPDYRVPEESTVGWDWPDPLPVTFSNRASS
jgi:cytochrome P450